MIFNDYTGETRSYLKKVGKDEAAEYIVPKTYSELRKERLTKDVQFDMMWLNVTRLSAQEETQRKAKADMQLTIDKLENELQSVKSQLAQIKDSVSSTTGKKSPSSSSSSTSKKTSTERSSHSNNGKESDKE